MDLREKLASALPSDEGRIGNTARAISLLAGSFIAYDAFAKDDHKLTKGFLAGFLLFRGTTGFCPASYTFEKGKHLVKAQNINIITNLSIQKPKNEIYSFWRNLENLPLFMDHLKSVKSIDGETSEWVAKIPGGLGNIKWKSEIVKDIPNEHLGWRSLPNSTIENAGNVKFLEAGKYGTEVHVVISYRAPVGFAGEGVGRMLNPAFEKMLKKDIKNLKRLMETGEIPTIKGQPMGSS